MNKNKNTNDNKFTKHFLAYKEPYTIGIGFVLWFIMLLLIATLGQTPPFEKNALEFGSLRITWYAIFILTGIIFAVILAIREAKYLGLDVNHLTDGILIAVPLAIIGARLYYVIFDPQGYAGYKNIGDVFNISGGGLAIHGAIITAIIFVVIYTKVRNMNIWSLLDILAPGFLIGQILGRWGNFFNQEAHGGPISTNTYNFLKVILPNFILENMNIGGIYYHPTFLYEGLWNLAGLIAILVVRRKRIFKLGDLIGLYLIWYGLGRGLLIEPFRTDPLIIFGLRVNVIFSLGIFVVGGIAYIIIKNLLNRDIPYYLDVVKENVVLVEKEKQEKAKQKKQ
ncbi:MAG: prolipoprotein diacylglyceryl transferase [Acholeplasmataceae bacterium]|nr:prolipoprotein diacylglyceryl transferase [Acholeplasmataceae bacterium]